MQFTGIDTIVFNAGHSPLVIDSVQFTGNAGYPPLPCSRCARD